jgi:hypothetical protein
LCARGALAAGIGAPQTARRSHYYNNKLATMAKAMTIKDAIKKLEETRGINAAEAEKVCVRAKGRRILLLALGSCRPRRRPVCAFLAHASHGKTQQP